MGHLAMTDTLMRELRSRTQGHGRPTWVKAARLPLEVAWWRRALVLVIGATPSMHRTAGGSGDLSVQPVTALTIADRS